MAKKMSQGQRFIIVAVTVILSILIGKEACGMGKTWMGRELERLIRQSWLKIGPFRVNAVLLLRNAGYDSNLYRRPYDPVKDYTITIGPGFQVYWPIKKTIVFEIYDSPQYVYFKETKKERTWNNYFNGQVHFVFTRIFI
ncbi:MAG: hypothetical protein JRI84_14580, partial [Deltaproteobacteria bacterium]|nr:hypothetical protein [Deltaproteobacteria bacterium]